MRSRSRWYTCSGREPCGASEADSAVARTPRPPREIAVRALVGGRRAGMAGTVSGSFKYTTRRSRVQSALSFSLNDVTVATRARRRVQPR